MAIVSFNSGKVNKKSKFFSVFCLIAFFQLSEVPFANANSEINNSNCNITFEIDSTWVLVKGISLSIDGSYTLAVDGDNPAISGNISVAVENFKTGNSSRDKHLREVMAEDKFKSVKVAIDGLKTVCLPSEVSKNGASCSGLMKARLTIRDISKSVELPYSISKNETNEFVLAGQTTILWADYNVEDPSIFIARVNPAVRIYYSLRLAPP